MANVPATINTLVNALQARPSGASTTAISAVYGRSLMGHRYDLESRKKRIHQLQSLLEGELANINRELDHVHNSLLPIYRLPPEVLSIIFRIVIGRPNSGNTWDKDSCSDPGSFYEYTKYAHILSSVCRRFHQVISNDNMVFTTLGFFLAKNRDAPQAVRVMEKYLLRSGASPFRLAIADDQLAGTPHDHTLTYRLHDILAKHTERFVALTVKSEGKHIRALLRLFSGHDWSSLRDVSLSFRGTGLRYGEREAEKALLLAALLRVPCLESLFIEQETIDMGDETYDAVCVIPLPALRRLRLRGSMVPRTVVPILRNAPGLEHLWWDVGEHAELNHALWESQETATLTMPRLLSLHLTAEAACGLPPIEAPRLEQLWIGDLGHNFDYGFADADMPPMLRMATHQVFPSLKRFAGLLWDSSDLADFFANNPTIEQWTVLSWLAITEVDFLIDTLAEISPSTTTPRTGGLKHLRLLPFNHKKLECADLLHVAHEQFPTLEMDLVTTATQVSSLSLGLRSNGLLPNLNPPDPPPSIREVDHCLDGWPCAWPREFTPGLMRGFPDYKSKVPSSSQIIWSQTTDGE